MKTVLVTDNSAMMRRIINKIITKHGFNVIGEANNGEACIVKYKELMPDIVTMNITMDKMDGLSTLKEIMHLNPLAKVVMVSAMGQDVIVKDAIITGAKGFIVKPFVEDQLVEALNKA